ncbi:MAG: McrC family protein [Bacteroidales bacterium]|jgi:5-methylcytosine-specific restriction endonuclease McrBC regulatory subunit McrC|nr:McrC family protein [Bacteroidales bacterium]
MLRTLDNNRNNPLTLGNQKDIDNLKIIANLKIGEIKPKDYPNLLVFPQSWQLGVKKKENSIFRISADNILTTGNIMGFIGVKDTELFISSRFATTDEKDCFLHYMLQKVLKINVVNLDVSKGKDDIHDFLPYLFPGFLQNALSQGLFKQYKRNQYNDANVKGAIDVNRHIRINIPFVGKIAYNTREHSYDNAVTQLIRHTIEHLRTRIVGYSLLNCNADMRVNVSQIEFATPSYRKSDLQKIIKANLIPVNHPYYTKYKPLQKLCLQILRREHTTFGKKDDKIHGLLFDGAWLWEEYMAKVFEENKCNIEHRITRRDKLFEKDDISKNQGIIPDFIRLIENTISASFIGDAKYKHIDTKDNREDYFQIITYMYRYSCKKGYLIFPYDKDNRQNEDDNKNLYYRPRIIYDGKEAKSKSSVIELGLKIPQNLENKLFVDFIEHMKDSEKQIVDKIIKDLNNF